MPLFLQQIETLLNRGRFLLPQAEEADDCPF